MEDNLVQKRLRIVKSKVKKQKLSKLKAQAEAFKPNQILFLKDSSEDLIDSLLSKIGQLGRPFVNHRKNTKVYFDSIKLLRKNYMKYRNEVFESFQLAHEFFNNPNFVFKPQSISVDQFFRFTADYLRYNQYANDFATQYQVKSIFREFKKGRGYIESRFLKKAKPKVNHELLAEFVKVWEKNKGDFNPKHEIEIFVFLKLSEECCKLNSKLTIRTIIFLLNEVVLSNPRYIFSTIKSLNSNFFWNYVLPKVVADYGLIRSESHFNKIGELEK